MNTSHNEIVHQVEDRPEFELRHMLARELVRLSDGELQFIPVDESLDEEGVYRLTLAIRYGGPAISYDGLVIREFLSGRFHSESDAGNAATRLTIAVPLNASKEQVMEVFREYLTGATAYRSPSAWLEMNDPREPRRGSALAQRESIRYLAGEFNVQDELKTPIERRLLRLRRFPALVLSAVALAVFVAFFLWSQEYAESRWKNIVLGVICALWGMSVGVAVILGRLEFMVERILGSKLANGGDDDGAKARQLRSRGSSADATTKALR